MRPLRTLVLFLAGLVALALSAAPAAAQRLDDAMLRPLVDALGVGSFNDKSAAIAALAQTADERVADILAVMREGDLATLPDQPTVHRAVATGGTFRLEDVLTGAVVGEGLGSREIDRVTVNNNVRRAIDAAIGSLTLMNPDPDRRRIAARGMLGSAAETNIPALEAAIAAETDAGVRATMEQALAASVLRSDADDAAKIIAVATIAEMGNQTAVSILSPLARGDGPVAAAAQEALDRVNGVLQMWAVGETVWEGLSAGSVLLLAAIGLAITFGVMGVINMAHGELVMIGAYSTYAVQQFIIANAPGLLDYSLLFALPVAFLVSGAVGVAIERGVIRWLYGRPLETLLATFGLSLVLQQAVRVIFGANPQAITRPSWMSDSFMLGEIQITYNRFWIFIFGIVVFFAIIAVLRRTSFGLKTRAVTQNRRMASAMGIRTPWVDALTFGLGSGIAGIAGVAMTQLDNVTPELGTGYIIDSFMVVVFGGVGSLWGTLVGAMSIGVMTKSLAPFVNEVVAKIIVLVLIILFIQRRPRGMFAIKGRAVEA